MKCFLAKINGHDISCDETNCAMWNNKRGECAIRSYCEAYLSMGLATWKLANATEQIEKGYDEDER